MEKIAKAKKALELQKQLKAKLAAAKLKVRVTLLDFSSGILVFFTTTCCCTKHCDAQC